MTYKEVRIVQCHDGNRFVTLDLSSALNGNG